MSTTPVKLYFYTVRPANGHISPDLIKSFDKWLEINCESYMVSKEVKEFDKNTEHLHMVIVLNKPRLHSNVKKSFRTLVSKHHNVFQDKLAIGYSNGVVSYCLKDGAPILFKNMSRVREIMQEDQAKQKVAIEEVYEAAKRNKMYALDNIKFWSNKLHSMLADIRKQYPAISWKHFHTVAFQCFIAMANEFGSPLGNSMYQTKTKYMRILSKIPQYKQYYQWYLESLTSAVLTGPVEGFQVKDFVREHITPLELRDCL